MSAYRLCDGLTIRQLPEGDAVVARDDGSTAVIVNASAAAILEALSTVKSEEEIVSLFTRNFPDQDPFIVRRDVARRVADLVKARIVEPCGGGPSTA